MNEPGTAGIGGSRYRLFLSGQILSGTGSWCYRTALPYILLREGRGGLVVGVAVGAGTFALTLLTPYASGVADRRNALSLCTFVNLALGVIFTVFFAAYLVVGGNLVLILSAALLAGAVTAFEAPARQRFLPELVGLVRWPRAIVATGVVYNVSRFAGPVLAVAIIAAAGPGTCIALNGLSFLAAAGTLWRIGRRPLTAVPQRPAPHGGWLAAMRICMRDRSFSIPVVCLLVVSLVAINEQATIPLLAGRLYGGDATHLSLLMAAVAAGALVAGIVLLRHRPSTDRSFAVAVLVLAVGNAGVVAGTGFAAILVVCAVLGAAIGAFTSIANVLIQTRAPLEYRARAFATFYLLMFGSTALGAPLSGALVDREGARAPFAAAAIVCLLVGGWLLMTRQVNQGRRGRDGQLHPSA
jgi:MFS family permease